MNVITLTGNATKDFELKYTPNGKPVGSGTIAVRRDFKNQQGEYETDFINLVVLGKLSEVMANHIRKGDKFGVTGRLQIRIWNKDNGEKAYFTEVVVNGFDFPDKKKQDNPPQQNRGNQRVNDDPFAGSGQIDINSDDLPF
ncbi:single-stranded DNA-binding protein [Neobacillus drentensis]|uniref:single-stranded DNA-binding protein n=1 Tax=Neobacillus drentensis TaxID=220684 RepID=UPI002FFE174B